MNGAHVFAVGVLFNAERKPQLLKLRTLRLRLALSLAATQAQLSQQQMHAFPDFASAMARGPSFSLQSSQQQPLPSQQDAASTAPRPAADAAAGDGKAAPSQRLPPQQSPQQVVAAWAQLQRWQNARETAEALGRVIDLISHHDFEASLFGIELSPSFVLSVVGVLLTNGLLFLFKYLNFGAR